MNGTHKLYSKAINTTDLNLILNDQEAIDQLNSSRPPLFIYTDFGAGKGKLDLQTSGELASSAWKATLQQQLLINDSATPLDPFKAACALAATFPYQAHKENAQINSIVMHVIDPGVGNDDSESPTHPRSLVLRKDGVLFIGPDNGTLSFVCPPSSINTIWHIDTAKVTAFSGTDLEAGGTFHGRDLFCEAACRIASGLQSCDDLGEKYPQPELKNRYDDREFFKNENFVSLTFTPVTTNRFELFESDAIFEQAFLLGIVQSPTQAHAGNASVTQSKKLFIVHPQKDSTDTVIVIFNKPTGNIFIGPNNGLGTSFFKGYAPHEYRVCALTKELFLSATAIINTESAALLLEEQPIFTGTLQEIEFLGDTESAKYDADNRPCLLQARIWIDAYGNIKTTASSTVLDQVKSLQGKVAVTLQGITHPIIFADTFSEVPANTLFLYNGSSAKIGHNPRRSKRYVEISSNGTFGTFGIDFFKTGSHTPKSGEEITFSFSY